MDMPEMPSECGIKEAEAFRQGFFMGAAAFYGTKHNSSSPVSLKHQYIQREWDRLARLGSISPYYVRILDASASSEKDD
jgi:hypothetical protein